MAPNTLTPYTVAKDGKAETEAKLRRIGPSLARVAAETAGAFLNTQAFLGLAWSPIPRLPDLGVLRCSQKNIGEKIGMVCNLSVDKNEWARLLGPGAGDDFSMDAFCEMANCICGGLIADPAFTDEFGYLIPCVPYAGHIAAPASEKAYRGAFRMGSAWIHFSITVHASAAALPKSEMMAA
jgi:hypothetical protein